MTRRGRGFTLIELLLALAAFSVAGVALAASLRTGYQAWAAGEASGRSVQEARRTLEDLGAELRNGLSLPGAGFEGSADSLSFDAREGGPVPRLTRLTYGPDPGLRVPARRAEPYGGTPRSRLLASGPASLSFAYPFRDPSDPSGAGIVWSDDWPGPEAPSAVKASLSVVDARGVRHDFVKVAWIPGGVWKKLESGGSR